MAIDPICSTCGTDFECFEGTAQCGDVRGWFTCPRRCSACADPLDGGNAVMEHPGLGARIHLPCCPSPEEVEPWALVLGG